MIFQLKKTFYRYYQSFYFHLIHSKNTVFQKILSLQNFVFVVYFILIAI